jgi:hypothetical protein
VAQLELPSGNSAIKFEGRGFDEEPVYKGVVIFNDAKLYFRSMISQEYIFSVVSGSDNFENTCWGIQLIGSSESADQSKAVRELLSDRLKALFPYDIQIGKSPHGYPTLIKDGVEIPVPVSFAHHDRYVAYSFILLE